MTLIFGHRFCRCLAQQKLYYRTYAVERRADVTSDDIVGADRLRTVDRPDEESLVVRFSPGATKRFETFTRAHIGGELAVVLDDKVLFTSTIDEVVASGSVRFGLPKWKELAEWNANLVVLGALPVPLKLDE